MNIQSNLSKYLSLRYMGCNDLKGQKPMKRYMMENTNVDFMNRNHFKQIDHKTLNGGQIWDWKN